MTVREIVEQYLRANGFDGLSHDDIKCECSFDDLFLCGHSDMTCSPGYKNPCHVDGCDFHIGPEKEGKNEN